MTADDVLTAAEEWLGYKPQANMNTPFGEKTGYNGNVWSGSFIDFIFNAAGVSIPSCVYSPSGLAEFIKAGRVHLRPRPGDIAFFAFPTGDRFTVPHVGLVADTSRWKSDGLVGTIEAQVNSGLAKSDPNVTGVYKRSRSGQEIIAFGRPTFRPGKGIKTVTGQRASVKFESIRPGRRNTSIGLVQEALAMTAGLVRPTVDLFDGPTQHAYARWQRIIGYVGQDANGVPDRRSLQHLGEVTGCFGLDA